MIKNIKKFVRERNAMLMTCTPEALRYFVKKHRDEYGTEDFIEHVLNADDELCLAIIHKMRFATRTLPDQARLDSMIWLTNHGYQINFPIRYQD